MAKQFDSATKYLVDAFPRDWLALAGLPTAAPVELIDANLSTITAEADKVIRVAGPSPWLAHIELQTGRDPRLDSRLCRYNALLNLGHDLPTRSIAILLRPAADGPELSGELRRSLPDGLDYLVFRYGVVRVWRQPVESILHGGLGILPLAPVADLGTMPLEAVVEELHQRIDPEPRPLRSLLWDATSIVMGLQHPAEVIERLLRGVHEMEESSFYQYILTKGKATGFVEGKSEGLAEGEAKGLAEGKVDEARAALLRLAENFQFGPISAVDRRRINKVNDLDRLRNWSDLILKASSWAEFWALVKNKKSNS